MCACVCDLVTAERNGVGGLQSGTKSIERKGKEGGMIDMALGAQTGSSECRTSAGLMA